jgi:ABC-type iron transport system FetAB permease component
VALVLAVSHALRLYLERSILASALRAAVQLFFLGYELLVPIFSAGSPVHVLELELLSRRCTNQGSSLVSENWHNSANNHRGA